MSFIRHRSTRLMLSGLAIAALLPLAVTAVPASAATSSSCGQPMFFGLHGMGEGPASNAKNSPEMVDMNIDLNNPAISSGVKFNPITYPDLKQGAWPVVLVNGVIAVTKGENALQSGIKSVTSGCQPSQDKIALVGYSLGAYIINKWIEDNPTELQDIKAVVLFGDPCWVDGKDMGLARRSALNGYGCMPAADYPYPAPQSIVPFQVESWTESDDPVTGANWGSKTYQQQLTAAENCVKDHCTHLDYKGTAETDGAQFILDTLGGAG